jgi:hypothetical protein
MEVMEHREKIGDYYGWKHITINYEQGASNALVT